MKNLTDLLADIEPIVRGWIKQQIGEGKGSEPGFVMVDGDTMYGDLIMEDGSKIGVEITPRVEVHADDDDGNCTIRASSDSTHNSGLQLYTRDGSDYTGWAIVKDANTGDLLINYDDAEGSANTTVIQIPDGGASIRPKKDVIMPNNIALRWLDSGGTPRNVLAYDSVDNIVIGVDGDDAKVFIERLNTASAGSPLQDSRYFYLAGNYWTGAAAQQRHVRFLNNMVDSGANPHNQLEIALGNEGAAATMFTLSNDNGTLTTTLVSTQFILSSAVAGIRFTGTAGGNGEGIHYKDTGGDTRYALNFPGADVVALCNRAANGTVQIRANAAAAGAGGEVTVATFEDDKAILAKALVATPDEITAESGGTAASLATLNTEVTTNGDEDLDNVTLANGTSGQIKHIYCVVEGHANDTWKITPASMVGGTQITFSGVGEGCTLVYADNEGWVVIGNNGGTIS